MHHKQVEPAAAISITILLTIVLIGLAAGVGTWQSLSTSSPRDPAPRSPVTASALQGTVPLPPITRRSPSISGASGRPVGASGGCRPSHLRSAARHHVSGLSGASHRCGRPDALQRHAGPGGLAAERGQHACDQAGQPPERRRDCGDQPAYAWPPGLARSRHTRRQGARAGGRHRLRVHHSGRCRPVLSPEKDAPPTPPFTARRRRR